MTVLHGSRALLSSDKATAVQQYQVWSNSFSAYRQDLPTHLHINWLVWSQFQFDGVLHNASQEDVYEVSETSL